MFNWLGNLGRRERDANADFRDANSQLEDVDLSDVLAQENLPREITVPDDALDPTARVEGPRTSQLEELSKEPPEELLCPIMHGLMTDPVMLCATGQIYDYSAIRPWLSNSNWRCPKTNTVIADPSVARVPALRQAAVKWAEENNIDTSEDYLHPPSSLSVAELESRYGVLGEGFPKHVRDLISAGDVRTRAQAAQEVLRVLVRTELAEAEAAAVEDLKGVVLDALLWLVRFGDFPAKGVAAAALECYRGRGDDQKWIAVSAGVPLVHTLASCVVIPPLEFAARALRVALERCSDASAQWLVHAGAVSALIRNIAYSLGGTRAQGVPKLNAEPSMSALYMLLVAPRTRVMALERMGLDGTETVTKLALVALQSGTDFEKGSAAALLLVLVPRHSFFWATHGLDRDRLIATSCLQGRTDLLDAIFSGQPQQQGAPQQHRLQIQLRRGQTMTIVETVQGGQTRQTRIQAPELFQGPAPAPVPAPEASTAHDAPSRTAAQAVTGGPAGVANAFGAMRLTDQVPAVPPTQQPQPLPSIRAGVPQGQGATPHGPPGGGQTAGGQAPLEAGAQDVGIQVTVRIHPDSHLHALRNQMQVTVVQRQGERALVRLQFPGNQVIQVQVPDEALATRRLNIDIAPQRNQPGAPAGQAAPGPPASPAGG